MLDFTTSEAPKPQVNLSALIDVAFILVIFIVLTATFREERDIEIQLPQTDSVPNNQAEGLQVAIHADGRIVVNGQPVAREGVRDALRAQRAEHKAVLLVADRDAVIQTAVEIMADAHAVGFESVAVATKERVR